uniref:Ras-related protein Rab n=2 Tax=Monodelphis domestica TaxID=13616 RepID=F6YG07_MONDO
KKNLGESQCPLAPGEEGNFDKYFVNSDEALVFHQGNNTPSNVTEWSLKTNLPGFSIQFSSALGEDRSPPPRGHLPATVWHPRRSSAKSRSGEIQRDIKEESFRHFHSASLCTLRTPSITHPYLHAPHVLSFSVPLPQIHFSPSPPPKSGQSFASQGRGRAVFGRGAPPAPPLFSSQFLLFASPGFSTGHTNSLPHVHAHILSDSPRVSPGAAPLLRRVRRACNSACRLGLGRRGRMQSQPREHLYKLLVIGDLGVGKTSIIKRYVHQNFSSHYRATIGVDFALKVLQWDPETVVRLQLWDIAGQERFGNMTRVYYREAMGAFIVFDVTRPATFEAVTKWKSDLDAKLTLPNGKPVSAVLLANKCDQGKDVLLNNGLKMDQFCKENGFVGWFETSAKENINIDEASRCLVKHILANESDLTQSVETDVVKPNLSPSRVSSCSGCSRS